MRCSVADRSFQKIAADCFGIFTFGNSNRIAIGSKIGMSGWSTRMKQPVRDRLSLLWIWDRGFLAIGCDAQVIAPNPVSETLMSVRALAILSVPAVPVLGDGSQ